MARPSKYTPEREQRILTALAAGNTRKAASLYGGIDQDTFSAWMKRYPDFSAAVEKAESDAEMTSVALIRQAAHETWTAAAWWLERRRAQDWGRVDRVELVIRKEAERLAEAEGLDASELIREAERIANGAR